MPYLSNFNSFPVVKKYSTPPTTENSLTGSSSKGINNKLFFLAIFLYQILFIFQGVDVGDGGSYATFYEQIFKNPESVQYNFMFWFSGIVGGLYMKLFPSLGIWGLRLAGVFISTSTVLVVYKLLKKYISPRNLQLSLFILILFINNNPKEFYYNNFSAFLYVLTALALYNGLKLKNSLYVFLSGVIIAFNMFNRFPNLLGLGLIILIFYYGYLNKEGIKAGVRNSLFLFAGFASAVLCVLIIMKLLGQLLIYTDAVKLLFSMGKSTNQRAVHQNGYGIFNLIKVLTKHYLISICLAASTFLFVLIILPMAEYLKKIYQAADNLILFIKYAFIIALAILTISGIIDNIILLYFFTGISLVTSLLILVSSKDKDVRFLVVLGCFFAIVHPMGSSEGIHTVIIYSLWICFPFAIDYLLKLRIINADLRVFIDHNDYSTNLFVNEYQLLNVKRIGIGYLLFASLFYSYYYPYFDKTNRIDMIYPVENYKMTGIYTSKGRAAALNDLLAESAKYVKPNDYVLAYDCIPLYYYLTDTRPYMKNSWPWLYQPDVFRKELETAVKEKNELPVVVTQIVKTMGDGGNWPYNPNPENSLTWDINEERNNYLNEFLRINHYREVWSSKYFKIYKPENSNAPVVNEKL